jgi:hypothetical protein
MYGDAIINKKLFEEPCVERTQEGGDVIHKGLIIAVLAALEPIGLGSVFFLGSAVPSASSIGPLHLSSQSYV